MLFFCCFTGIFNKNEFIFKLIINDSNNCKGSNSKLLSQILEGVFSFLHRNGCKFLNSLLIFKLLFIVLLIEIIVLLLKEELIGILLLVSKLLLMFSLLFLF